ncbi:MAG: gas vesicle protein GvpN, partial [Chloroflexi bacterium]|nr:gas vesicle protein GvpN [Chloroflexota bacterium]
DALRDRLVTLDLDHFDEETEVAITAAKSGLPRRDAHKIVRVARALREAGVCEYTPTIRGPIMIAKTLKVLNGSVRNGDAIFRKLCLDVLASQTSRVGSRDQSARVREVVDQLIDQYC